MHQAMLLAVKVLAKTMDSTTLTSEKRKLPLPSRPRTPPPPVPTGSATCPVFQVDEPT